MNVRPFSTHVLVYLLRVAESIYWLLERTGILANIICGKVIKILTWRVEYRMSSGKVYKRLINDYRLTRSHQF